MLLEREEPGQGVLASPASLLSPGFWPQTAGAPLPAAVLSSVDNEAPGPFTAREHLLTLPRWLRPRLSL